ncbi:hypothetical protein [Flavobacterium sp. N2820]|uniref:hypothetical protein n=1 Tax=Flavobacterium sp. N2820 TaxID=2986834 RepID=UPI0022249AFA|nr:hypothetical protein [Flavobacterium sp. N2820]
MKEKRKKISFREEITISKLRLWGGFIVSTLLSFSGYLFFTCLRDLYRLFSLTEDFEYLKFSSEELQFYNLFYAFLGLLIGLHFYLKISFDTNKQFLSKDILFKKSKTINNQNSLIWYFLSFFSKVSFIYGGFIMSSFGLEKNYNLNLFNHINFYREYKLLFLLIILVLLSQSLMTPMITFKTKIKIVLLIILFAFLFSQFNLIDVETLITKMKSQ